MCILLNKKQKTVRQSGKGAALETRAVAALRAVTASELIDPGRKVRKFVSSGKGEDKVMLGQRVMAVNLKYLRSEEKVRAARDYLNF